MMIQNIPPRYVLIINPFSALSSIFASGGVQTGPLGMLGIFAGMNPGGDPARTEQLKPLWYYTVAAYLALTTFLYLLSTRFIKPIRPWRIGWREVAVVGVIILLFLGISATIFGSDVKTMRRWAIEGTPTPNFGGPMMIEPAIMQEAVPLPVDEVAPDQAVDPAEEPVSDDDGAEPTPVPGK
jgi:hypothetical protein